MQKLTRTASSKRQSKRKREMDEPEHPGLPDVQSSDVENFPIEPKENVLKEDSPEKSVRPKRKSTGNSAKKSKEHSDDEDSKSDSESEKEEGKKTKGRKKKHKLSSKSRLKAGNKQKREVKNKLPAEVGSPVNEITSGNDVNVNTCENVSTENKCNQQKISSLFKKHEASEATEENGVDNKKRKLGRLSLKSREKNQQSEDGENKLASIFTKQTDKLNQTNPSDEKIEPAVSAAPSLVNLGNTCYLNSVLQVLFYTPQFVDSYTSLAAALSKTEKDLSLISSLDHGGNVVPTRLPVSWKLARNLFELMQKMQKSRLKVFEGSTEGLSSSPSEILETLESLNPIFKIGQQQDAHELLQSLLSFSQEAVRELNRCRDKLKKFLLKTVDENGSDDKKDGPVSFVSTTDQVVPEIDQSCLKQNGICANVKTAGDVKTVKPETKKISRKKKDCNGNAVIVSPDAKKNEISTQRNIASMFKQSESSPKGSCSSAPVSPPCFIDLTTTSEPSSKLDKKSDKSSASTVTKLAKSVAITSFFGSAVKPKASTGLNVDTSVLHDFITDTFQGMLEMRTRCLECEHLTKNTEDFSDVPLPVNKNRKICRTNSDDEMEPEDEGKSSLSDWIFRALDEVERLQSDNKFWCNECMHLVEAERFVCYTAMPDILVLQLKRFAAFGLFGGFTKSMDRVDVPFILPCIESSCRSTPESKHDHHWYELYAVVSHSGFSLSAGHYIAYVRAPQTETILRNMAKVSSPTKEENNPVKIEDETMWYECDDDMVSLLPEERFRAILSSTGSNTPYMLFYSRAPQRTTIY